jgi:hypothetical protein
MKPSTYLQNSVKTHRNQLRIALLVLDGFLGWQEVELILTTLQCKEKIKKNKELVNSTKSNGGKPNGHN